MNNPPPPPPDPPPDKNKKIKEVKTHKCCSICNETKLITEYRTNSGQCKPCLSKKAKEWNAKNRIKKSDLLENPDNKENPLEIIENKNSEIEKSDNKENPLEIIENKNSLLEISKHPEIEVLEDPVIEYKECLRCNVVQPLDAFKFDKGHCYDCQKKMSNDWKARNREKNNAYNKEYKKENKEAISEYNKKYNIDNRAEIQKRSTATHARLKKENPSFKMACTLRNRILVALKRTNAVKVDKTKILLGCSMEFFREWFKYCFTKEMTFENHGSIWHIDHTVPCSKFDLEKEEEQRKCFHWTNMKPMLARENMSKNNKIDEEEIKEHERKLGMFIGEKGLWWAEEYTFIDIDRLSYALNSLTI
jgi:hypothetical protein